MSATLIDAIRLALDHHGETMDIAGHEPYLLHPLRVMLRLRTQDERIAGVLHDVVEDSEWSLDDLAAEGFSSQVLAAVDALTKRAGESRVSAARRAVRDPIATAAKLADNAENMDLSRIAEPTAKDHARMEVYAEVRAILLGSGATDGG